MILVPTLSRANSRESYDLFPLPHLRLDAPARARPSLSVEGRAPAVKPAPGLQSAYAGHDATMGEITYSSAEWLTERSKRAWLFVTVRINFHYVTDRLLRQPRVPAGSPALFIFDRAPPQRLGLETLQSPPSAAPVRGAGDRWATLSESWFIFRCTYHVSE